MEPLGPLQLRVMLHIWSDGPCNVHQVHDALNAQLDAPKQLAYTTVLTVMRSLANRGFLDQKPEGKAHRFAPLIDLENYKLEMVKQMRVDLFDGDVGRLLQFIAQDDGIEATKRARIRDLAGQ